jgi:hypothetical protein
MIDHIALAIGHGLMAIALLRLVMRAGLDDDPLIGELKSDAADNRRANSSAGRNAARRGGTDGEDAGNANDAAAHKTARSSSEAVAQTKTRSRSEAVAQTRTRSSSEAVARKNA